MSISKIWIIFRTNLNMSSIDNENILSTKMNVFLSFYNTSASSSENMLHGLDQFDGFDVNELFQKNLYTIKYFEENRQRTR